MELCDLPAHILAENIRLRQVKAIDALEAALARIAAVDGDPPSLEPADLDSDDHVHAFIAVDLVVSTFAKNHVIAGTTRSHFRTLNAVLAGVKDIREAIADAETRLKHHRQRTILFIDEVHRFNKAQQDALLPHVENGTVTFIGATTENPYFEVIKALVSRSRVFELKGLTEDDLRRVARFALENEERGYGRRNVVLNEDALPGTSTACAR